MYWTITADPRTGRRRSARAVGGDSAAEVKARLAAMDEAGIDLQVLSEGPQAPYLPDQSQAVTAAQVNNQAYAALLRDHPDRFQALASLPLPHVPAAVGELHRTMDLGFKGAAVTASVAGRPLSDPGFEPLFAALDQRDAVLLIHPAGDSAGSRLMNDSGLGWIIGHATEVSMAVLQIFQAGLTQRYPRIKIIAVHLCGFVPFLAQRLDLHRDWYMPPDSPPVATLLRSLYYDSANPHPGALRLAAEILGPDRIMLGTDYPFEQGASYLNHVTYLTSAGLTSTQVAAIQGETATRLLGLQTPD